jgi:hypothetical protein
MRLYSLDAFKSDRVPVLKNCGLEKVVTHKRRLEGKNIENDNIKPIQLSLFL